MDFVKDAYQLGNVRLDDGKNLAIFEVCVDDKVQLTRNRVALRDLIAKRIDLGTTHGVLCVFNSSDPEYRFTFVCRETSIDDDGNIETTETNPKRFTYILGPGETRRTAAQRFQELAARRDHAGIKEIVEAFSVERLNKEFFQLYKEHYQAFVDHLIEDTDAPLKVFGVSSSPGSDEYEIACKPVRDWVKKLLGRIVFIHFIQKKGWMGCKSSSKAWKDGDPQFLRNLFEGAKDKDHFYSKSLARLFFEALNAPDRPGDIFDLTGTKVPYLNGGLFDESEQKTSKLDFPSQLFKGLLDFFASYNFTIDENDPEEHEVGIDPEMLGHIFENLLEENKDKGAYYTPKPVVQFMCQQSILLYLKTHLGDQEGLEKLVRQKDSGDNSKGNWIRQHASRIEELLDKVTICDPAIGSGAFPMGMLQEIFWIKLALDWTLNDPAKFAETKRRIIEHTIHGVDLDAGAVEIARLRCWLSLVVDEVEPRPLPNLEFKIHCANSLIESMRGEPVDFLKHETLAPAALRHIKDLEIAKTDLFEASRKPEKRAARLAIYRAMTELGKLEFTWMRTQEGLFGSGDRAMELDNVLKDFNLFSKQLATAEKLPVKEQEDLLIRTQQWFQDTGKPTFAWRIHFAEVFAKGGFDIVIENPPYIRNELLSDEFKDKISSRFPELGRRSDIYCYFYAQCIEILKLKGIGVIISSNSWLDVGYGTNLQRILLNKSKLLSVVDSSHERTFENADINTIIAFVQKDTSSDDAVTEFISLKYNFEVASINKEYQRIICRNKLQLIKEGSDSSGKYIGGKWGGRYLRAPDVYWKILSKSPSLFTTLGEISTVAFGLKTGANQFFYTKLVGSFSGGYIIQDSEGLEHKIGSEVNVLPAITKTREIDKYLIEKNDCNLVLLGIPRENLSEYTIKYIERAEAQNIHKRPSTRGRRPWFSIQLPVTPPLIFPSAHKRRPVIGLINNNSRIIVDKRFYTITPENPDQTELIAACLATSFSTLCREVHGRANFGQGMLEVIVEEAKTLPVIKSLTEKSSRKLIRYFNDMASQRIPMLYDNIRSEDRAKLDESFLEAIGYSDPSERILILQELQYEAAKAMWTRQAKAINTREARIDFNEFWNSGTTFEYQDDEQE